MAACDKCGKHGMFGNRVSHSKRRTRHQFAVNVQTIHVIENNLKVRKHLCTKCIKALNKI